MDTGETKATRTDGNPDRTPPVQTKADGKPQCKAILLIGSTGSGKSTLGNCLLGTNSKSEELFSRGRTGMPHTQHVKSAAGLFSQERKPPIPLIIIDTPGLNESAAKDLDHMIEVIQSLRDLKEISACVLCVKFSSQIDTQYMETVRYYREMLPNLFAASIAVVFTDYSDNDHEVKKRKREGINPDEMMANAVDAIVSNARLDYRPMHFCIDVLPGENEEDRKCTMTARAAIIDYVDSQLSGAQTNSLLVVKTPALRIEDRRRAAKLDGQIRGYSDRLKHIKMEAKDVLDKVMSNRMTATALKAKRNDEQKYLTKINTEELVPAKHWSLKQEWKAFSRQSAHFDIESEWPVKAFKYWDNGHLKWKNVVEKYQSVSGDVAGKFSRGLFASVTLLTFQSLKYANDIAARNRKLQDIKAELAQAEYISETLHREQAKHRKEIADLEGYINDLEDEKEECLEQNMTLEVAHKRLLQVRS